MTSVWAALAATASRPKRFTPGSQASATTAEVTIAARAQAVGAFPLTTASKDAVLLLTLPPGAYTVQLTGVGNATGVGIVEVYDVDP